MKLWRAYWQDADCGSQYSWHDDKTKAERDLDARLSFYDGEDYPNGEPSGVELVAVPTKKSELIAWLNNNFTSDNE